MTEQPAGPRCGNNPNMQLTPGDRKAVDDFKARLALQADARPYIDSAVWVDGDPLMEVIAVTVYERCETGDGGIVHDDPRTIAAFAAAVARAHAVVPSAPADRGAILREAAGALMALDAEARKEGALAWTLPEVADLLRRMAGEAQQPEICELPHLTIAEEDACEQHRLGDEAQQPETQALPQPEGPEYTPCACDHIEPEHEPNAGACWSCDCEGYRATPSAPLRRSEADCPGFPEQCPNLRPVDPDPPVHLGGIRCGCADEEPTS